MPSKAKTAFLENSKDISELWRIHEEMAGEGPGRKHGVEVLNRAAVVFITACWESYVEDLAKEAFDHLLARAKTAATIPVKVRTLATASIFAQKDGTKVWDIADDGWRALLISHRQTTFEKWLGNFNTPKTEQVNALYLDLLGIKKLSSNWSWQGMAADKAGDKLDTFIGIRGDIAHRLHHGKGVNKQMGTRYHEHVKNIVICCELAVRDHLVTLTKRPPW